jgi:nicotinate-nucleotide adenylyltransferase
MRIALYGGSFDPIHLGHLAVAQAALRQVHLDQVCFIPCKQNPLKQTHPGAEDRHRLEMVLAAVQRLPWARVSDWELERSSASYSWQTVEHFRSRWPAAKLFWIVGGDQWEALEKWAKPEYLAAQVEFIVFPRHGQPLQPKLPFIAHFLEGRVDVSSTRIREHLAAGRPPEELEGQLPLSVLRYIEQHALYRR